MSHRGDLTERLAVLPVMLAEKPHTQRELAEHFNVAPRTIRRSVDELSRYHPITIERKGREVRYRFGGKHLFRSPVLTVGELSVLLLAQESIAATGLTGVGTPFAQYGESLLRKVRESLPPSLRERFTALSSILGSATVPAKDFSRHVQVIDTLVAAASMNHRVRLRYYTLARNAVTERKVDPYVIYFDPDGATLKLIGYDHYRKGILPFAIDHIQVLEELDERFRRPVGFNLREYLTANCFNGIHGAPVRVVLKAYGVTARVFAERSFHPSQQVIERVSGITRGRKSRLAQVDKGTRSSSKEGLHLKRSDMGQGTRELDVHSTGVGERFGAAHTQIRRKQSQVAKRVGQDARRRRGNRFSSEWDANASSSEWEANSFSSRDAQHRYEAGLDLQESTTIELTVAGGRGLMRFILSWGADVEVLEPESLRREVALAHRRALERY